MPSFWWCDIFVIFNFVWGFLSSFEATTFLPFSGISYIRGEENFGLEFAKILSEKNQVRVKMEIQTKIDAQQIIEF